MARLTPQFSASRAVREYTENHYLPATSGYLERAARDSALGVTLLEWQQDIARHWNTAHIGTLDIKTHDGQHFFRVEVFPGGLNPDELSVELYADPVQGAGSILEGMTACTPCADSPRANLFGSGIRNPFCEGLHSAHHPSTCERFCAA